MDERNDSRTSVPTDTGPRFDHHKAIGLLYEALAIAQAKNEAYEAYLARRQGAEQIEIGFAPPILEELEGGESEDD